MVRASRRVWMPLMMSGPVEMERIHSRSARVIEGSNSLFSRSPMVPLQLDREVNVKGSVVSRFNHHAG